MPGERLLILGGTGEAVELAGALTAAGYETITSFAGVTAAPVRPVGGMRRGGFGGADGLRAFLVAEKIEAVIDGTHPFATQISGHAVIAAAAAGIPLLRLERPAWAPEPGDRWTSVSNITDAAAALPPGARPLVTIGRKEVVAFFARSDLTGVARMIEPPVTPVPQHWTLLLERPPFTIASERDLIIRHCISHLVTKNAGGEATRAKLVAAREKNVPVIMVERPEKAKTPSFSTIAALIPALRRLLCP